MKVDQEGLKKAAQEFLEKAKTFAVRAVQEATSKPPPGTVREPLFNLAGSPRAMKFPYTFTAKFVQFPWVYYVKNCWVYKYYFVSVLLSIPVIKMISNVVNSPANVKKWEEIRRKEREELAHRH